MFTDFTAFNFPLAGPGSPFSQVFNNTLQTGVGSFAINPGALAGRFVLDTPFFTYELFSVSPLDPAFDPNTDTLRETLCWRTLPSRSCLSRKPGCPWG